ncbi:M20 peptidase aminoacylase family protein [Virgibacillus siamensis]|uniref:M20 peptidase aminoacylase family protein n=1 Tax=Virgibacillus siamensis TaxID=480071 RepID=UPI000985D4BD|nr:M20 peptidase aminoacylase family protein [Virgibacillus siamensis]
MKTDPIDNKIMNIFEHLHNHPEISWHETETTNYIKQILENHGCKITTFDDCTGVIGEIGNGDPVVAVRADMDALWQEVNGRFCANHSCGHDSHMSMVLGVLLKISEMDSLPQGTIRFIFQPAEEKGTGALKMIEKGVIDDVSYMYGVHLRPVHEVKDNMAAPAILHGAGQHISGEIKGEDTHGARPHLGVNAIEVGAELLQKLNHIHADPQVPHSIKFTKFQAGGESSNVIPGSAAFSIDIRAQRNDVIDELASKVKQSVQSVSAFYNVPIELDIGSATASANSDKNAQKIMSESIGEVLGEENIAPPVVTSGSEDFHFYTFKKPDLKATLLGLGCDLKPGLHHPYMTFNHDMIVPGSEILLKTVLKTLTHLNKKGD